MDRNGVRPDYERYGVTKAQEQEWRQEYIALWVSRLSAEDLTAVNRLRDARAVEALPDLIRMADRGDSYARLWYANAIWEIAQGANVPPPLQLPAVETAIRLWQSLVDGDITLTDERKNQIAPAMNLRNEATPEQYVRNYAASQLDRAKSKP